MWILSVDQASHACGVALWRDGELVESRLLRAKHNKAIFSDRMRDICGQLNELLDRYEADVELVLVERVDQVLVSASVGAILMCPRIRAPLLMDSFVSPSTWKSWAVKRGAPGMFRLVKGVAALAATGFKPVPKSDDEADAIMIFLGWKDKNADKINKRRNR